LLPDYQKREELQIGQAFSHVTHGYYNTWDELYASTIHNANDSQKITGKDHIRDYNADGIMDSYDKIAYGFTVSLPNTYNITTGVDWKGFSAYVQLYGVNNVSRQVVLGSLTSQNHIVYDEGSYWSKDNIHGNTPIPRWLTTPSGFNDTNRFFYDGSYVRLKNAEIAYTFDANSSLDRKSTRLNS